MAILNIVTEVKPVGGVSISKEQIQEHFDAQNAEGYHLIGIDNLVGWYRFFWAKEET